MVNKGCIKIFGKNRIKRIPHSFLREQDKRKRFNNIKLEITPIGFEDDSIRHFHN